MAAPAAVLSVLVKTKGAAAAAAELRAVDKAALGANSKLSATQAHGRKTGGTLRALGGAAKYTGGLIGAAGLAMGVKLAVSEFREAQKVGAQTAAVLKSTGGAANVTQKDIEKLSGAISRKAGIDDEAIQSSANMLLTFTNVRNEVGKGNDIFNQATQTVTDMSVALGQSGKSSAIQLGKALQDPVKGATALRRVGVMLTDQQKEQITTLVEHGDKLGAQKIILHELTREFGGSAAAQATAGDKMRVALGNLAEAAGRVLVPAIDKVVSAATKFINGMQDGTGAGGRFAAKMKRIWEDLQPLIGALKTSAKFLKDHPALLVAAGAAWVAYKTAALVQLALTKAAMLGLFGGETKALMVAKAGATGGASGKAFAAKAGAVAAAGVAGWEIGSWLRKHSGAVRSAGDFLGKQLGEAFFGSAHQGIDDAIQDAKNPGSVPGKHKQIRHGAPPPRAPFATKGSVARFSPSYAQQLAESDLLLNQTGAEIQGIELQPGAHDAAQRARSTLLSRHATGLDKKITRYKALLAGHASKAKKKKWAAALLSLTEERAGIASEINLIASDLAGPGGTSGGGGLSEAEQALLEQDQQQHEELLAQQAAEAQAILDAQNEAAEAARQQTEAVNALKDQIQKQNDFANSVNAVSLGAAWKAMADMISGQIYGQVSAKAATAGSGVGWRY